MNFSEVVVPSRATVYLTTLFIESHAHASNPPASFLLLQGAAVRRPGRPRRGVLALLQSGRFLERVVADCNRNRKLVYYFDKGSTLDGRAIVHL